MTQAGASYESSLLLTLEEISRLVSHSHDPQETLDNIVRLIQGRFHTAVCSVYVLEPDASELVLSATVGLKPESIGRVRMRLDEGLTGLVAQQMAPVMVADAFTHPRFKYFPEAGEDPYHSFLGVPLVESGSVQGVLVVQTAEPREFSASEIRMLVTVAAQLASLVGDAHLLERIAVAAHHAVPTTPTAATPSMLHGVPLSPGSGVGQAYVVDGFEQWRRTVVLTGSDVAAEKRRLADALRQAREELAHLSQRISELVGEDHGAILHAQLMIMQDRTIERDLTARLDQGASAEGALLATLDQYVEAFRKMATPFFQERVYDVKDVFHRLLWQLRPRPEAEGDRVVLVAREASVMELFAVDLDRLAGVVVEHGGAQSHAAILARSLSIPMVGQVSGFAALLRPGRRLLLDGQAGTVTLDPLDAGAAGWAVDRPGAETSVAAAPETTPRIEVNVNLLCEVGPAVRQGVGGVGLYRSEFLFLARRTLPTEEEQVAIYRKLLGQLGGRPVSIRTFDLRPDKLASYSHLGTAAARPFDWRLVLESAPLQQLFRDQVRAILRAGVLGPVRILVPLVTSGEMLDFVLTTLREARQTLVREGLEHAADVPLGVMLETAAALPLARVWASDVAYFALGTNDLASSALGVDRDDPVAVGLADPLHPGLLRLIARTVDEVHDAGRSVTVCGEVAADPLGALALAALGVDVLSVPVNQFAAARQAVAGLTAEQLHDLAPRLLEQRTGEAVRQALQEWRKMTR
jgi:phosphotransferase system enzyme I (PtsP)